LAPDLALYERVLGEQFFVLPDAVQRLHSNHRQLTAKGVCDVQQGTNYICRFIAWLIGFPASGSELPIRVDIEINNQVEKWTRIINNSQFSSQLTDGIFNSNICLVERFGYLVFYFALPVTQDGLTMKLLGVRAIGMPIPKWCWPVVDAKETVRDDKFYFDVKVSLPIFGLLTYYQGYLDIEERE